jgi:drug/metabolite transporter (DMT)-like permease
VAGGPADAGTEISASDRRLAEVGALAVMVVWAGNFIVVKGALTELPPVAFTTIRFALAAVVLLVACRLIEGSVRLPRRDVIPLFALGAVGFGIYQPLWTIGLSQTTAADSALLIAATPMFTLLIAAAIGSDHLTANRVVGAAVSFLGVGLVVVSAAAGGLEGHLAGDVITLIAAALWACYVAFGAPVLRRHSPLRTTTWAVTFGTLVMAPLGLWQLGSVDWAMVTTASLVAVLYAGVLSIAVGNVVQFRAVRAIGPARTVSLQFLVPALTVVLAAVFLHEQIRLEQVVGGIVIVIGILVARRDGGTRAVAGERQAEAATGA